MPKIKIELNISLDGQDLQWTVNKCIEDNIENVELRELLKKMLVVNCDDRWSFRNFPQDSEIINEATVKYDFDDDEEDQMDKLS